MEIKPHMSWSPFAIGEWKEVWPQQLGFASLYTPAERAEKGLAPIEPPALATSASGVPGQAPVVVAAPVTKVAAKRGSEASAPAAKKSRN